MSKLVTLIAAAAVSVALAAYPNIPSCPVPWHLVPAR
jgi:hypothetical protein